MNTLQIPDSITPIIGWRVWWFRDLLGSLNHRTPVIPNVPQVAQCHSLRNHEVPDEHCTCGIYAFADRRNAMEELGRQLERDRRDALQFRMWLPSNLAIGQISLWGKVIEHELGFRAEFGYPKTVSCRDLQTAERLAKLYGIEVETSCNWEEFAPYYESRLSEMLSLYVEPPTLFGGISRSPSPPKTKEEQKKYDLSQLPASYLPENDKPLASEVTFPVNRSVPRQLRAQVAHKEANAKSEFWKRL